MSNNDVNFIVKELIELCKKNDKQICFIDGNGERYTWYDYLINIIKIATFLKKIGLKHGDYVYINNKTTYLTNPYCHFIMMACMYNGLCFVSVEYSNIKKNKQIIMNDYKCKIEFLIDTKETYIFFSNLSKCENEIIKKYFHYYDGIDAILFNEILKLKFETDEYIEPFSFHENNNYINNNYINRNYIDDTIFIITTDISDYENTYDITEEIKNSTDIYEKIIKIDINNLEHIIKILKSNYNIDDKGKYISHSVLTTVETIIFDVFFHVLTNSQLYFLENDKEITLDIDDKIMNKIKDVNPTFIHGDITLWSLLYKRIHMNISSIIHNEFIVNVIENIMNIIKYINLLCYSYDKNCTNTSIIKLLISFFIRFIHLFIKKIFKFYKKIYGLDDCTLFINNGKKLDLNMTNYFYSIDVPINYIFSYIGKGIYKLISLTNKYEIDTVGHLICKAYISDDGYLFIENENENENENKKDNEKNNNLYLDYLNTNYKGKILDNGKLQLEIL